MHLSSRPTIFCPQPGLTQDEKFGSFVDEVSRQCGRFQSTSFDGRGPCVNTACFPRYATASSVRTVTSLIERSGVLRSISRTSCLGRDLGLVPNVPMFSVRVIKNTHTNLVLRDVRISSLANAFWAVTFLILREIEYSHTELIELILAADKDTFRFQRFDD
ncbi:hypothetical protein M8J77_016656 [Diaphorina citri]|nr:hypothetical protein M8J77_016656 [Diaphorina citri]